MTPPGEGEGLCRLEGMGRQGESRVAARGPGYLGGSSRPGQNGVGSTGEVGKAGARHLSSRILQPGGTDETSGSVQRLRHDDLRRIKGQASFVVIFIKDKGG